MDLESLTPYFIALLPVLVAAWIGIRVSDVRSKRQIAKEEYDKFKDAIWPFLHSILSGESNLNVELLEHFPSHKNAAREYAQCLKGKKKKKFIELWLTYEEEYEQIKSLGPFAAAVAVAPSEVDLNSNPGPSEMIRWERDRVNKLSKLLTELLEVAKVKIWF